MIAAAVVGTSPNYDLEIVTQATLTEVIEQHPLRLTVDELALRIVNNPGDYREVEIAIEAIDDLRRAGVVRYHSDDRLVEPTQAAMRTHELLTAM